MDYRIIPMLPNHWPAVREIYREGIATGNATFETEIPDWEKWHGSHREDCRLVADETFEPKNADDQLAAIGLQGLNILGWTALSPVSTRRVYRGVAEGSVYVAASARGQGIGKALLQELVQQSELNGICTLQAGFFP